MDKIIIYMFFSLRIFEEVITFKNVYTDSVTSIVVIVDSSWLTVCPYYKH